MLGKIFRKKQQVFKGAVVVLGPSKAGKTTLVRYLETEEVVDEDPRTTLGIDFRKQPIKIDGVEFSTIDVGGQKLYADAFWSMAIEQANAIIFVIDGLVRPEDTGNFQVALESFNYMLNLTEDHANRLKPLLILVNKQDLVDKNPLNVKETVEYFKLSDIIAKRKQSITVVPTSAKLGEGVEDGIIWLAEKMIEESN